MPASPRRGRLSLTGYLLIANVLLLVLAVASTGAMWVVLHDRAIDRQYTQRVLALARSVAVLPEIRAAFDDDDPADTIAPLADRINTAADAQFVVIANTEGIRYSHPVSSRIGEHVSTPPGPALDGEHWTGIQEGTEGSSVRAKVPVYEQGDDGGTVVGYVSLGILESDVDSAAASALPLILGTVTTVLVLGGAGAYVISRRIRAKTHGLEPAQITSLLEGREALLYAVREGVLALDADHRVTLVNEPARSMLGLPASCEGRSLAELSLDPRLHDVVSGADPGADRILLAGARTLVCNRMPVRIAGRYQGSVVTLRDHTELERLTGELDGARTLTRGLRAQSHEFANRIHTVAGMLELGAYDEARAFLTELSAAHTRVGADVGERVGDPALAALLLAKTAQAAERGAELRLAAMTRVEEPMDAALRSDVLLVLGNLTDNALDSVDGGGWIEVMVRHHVGAGLPHDLVEVRVEDCGPGLDPHLATEIFSEGFTTKVARGAGQRGLGLALVRQTCENRGGQVLVENPNDSADPAEFTTFTAYLPVAREPADAETT